MKKMLFVFGFVMMLAVLLVTPVFAMQSGEDAVTDPVQLYLIGVIASVIVYVIRLISQQFPNVSFKREWLTVFLYVIAVVLSVMWKGVALPAFGEYSDPVSFVSSALKWVSDIMVVIGPALAFATLIYNLLLKKVLEHVAVRAGWTAAG